MDNNEYDLDREEALQETLALEAEKREEEEEEEDDEHLDEVKIFHKYLGRPEKDGSFQSKMERSHIARGAKERRALTPGSGVSGFNKAMDRKLDPKTYKNKSREAGEVRARNEVSEETLAASSLHPKARPGEPMSKLGAMHGVMNVMAGMGKSDLINFFNQVQSQFGPGKDWGVGDKSDHNQSTIDMKPSDATGKSAPKTRDAMPKLNVKEDIEEMFNGQDLSEEFKETVSTLFEAAVSARIISETALLEEEFETKLQEELAIFNEELTSKLDAYLDYCVENFMKENEVAIESTLRNELAEEFIEGLKDLFAEHYISVPEDKVDVLEAMAEKVSALEAKLDESISENAELKNIVLESERRDIVEDLASDLALTQQEKFSALVEGIEFDGDLDIYAKKLMIVKENYFKTETTSHSSNIEEETFEGVVTESVNVDPVVNRYVQAIARTVKN